VSDDRDFESRFYSLDLGVQIVFDWLVNEGAQFDGDSVGHEPVVICELRGVEYAVGPHTGTDGRERLADAAAMIAVDLLLDRESLEAKVNRALVEVDVDGQYIDMELPDTPEMPIFFIARPSHEQVEENQMDEFMRGFVRAAEKLQEELA
jgi:hypothetical protein